MLLSAPSSSSKQALLRGRSSSSSVKGLHAAPVPPRPRSALLRTSAVATQISSAHIRDADGQYGATLGAAAGGPQADTSTPSVEELMADLYPEERLTVKMFQDHANSVVNVSTSLSVYRPFSFDVMQIPRGDGSGFIWDNKGHVITNSHVVAQASKVSVTLYDGSTAEATVVGRDSEKDVAVLKLVGVPPEKLAALNPIRLGSSSNLLVGQKVYALGNPFGLELSLTQGIVSGLGREIGNRRMPITNVIQTDAAINPGNSGGPLLDSRGRLVGVNTAILDPTGTGISSGVGFAIPVDSMKGLVDQILKYGKVIRPAMGISIAPVPTSLGKAVGKEKADGVLVVSVRPGGPADVAGIQPTKREIFGRVSLGDIIIAVNGKPVKKQQDLFAALDSMQVGQAVEVTLAARSKAHPQSWDGSKPAEGRQRTVKVVLADREKMQWGSE